LCVGADAREMQLDRDPGLLEDGTVADAAELEELRRLQGTANQSAAIRKERNRELAPRRQDDLLLGPQDVPLARRRHLHARGGERTRVRLEHHFRDQCGHDDRQVRAVGVREVVRRGSVHARARGGVDRARRVEHAVDLS
jgi:hypothetical protein